jgi:hypothetical protein
MTQEAGMQAQIDVILPEGEHPGPTDEASGTPAAESRALVPVHPVDVTPRRYDRSRYPSATFVAHLIAVDRRLPQMRTRGRAAPADAAAVYSAVLTETPVRTGCRLRRSA